VEPENDRPGSHDIQAVYRRPTERRGYWRGLTPGAAGHTSSPSHVPLKSVFGARPGSVAGQCSNPSHVPLKSVLAGGPALAAGAVPFAAPQVSIPSHVPPKSVLARAGLVGGAAFVVGALVAVGTRFGAATETVGLWLAGGIEAAAGGGRRERVGAVAGNELAGGVLGALLEHPPANKTKAAATGTTILRICVSLAFGRQFVTAPQNLWLGIADPQAIDFSIQNPRRRGF
jgi:hypothetical protein